MNRSLLVGTLLVAAHLIYSAPQASGPKPARVSANPAQPFFEKNCYGCHSPANASGGLNLHTFKGTSVSADVERWERILQRVASGEMPPKPLPRPPAKDVEAVTAWIHGEIARADKTAKLDPGRVTARRLNRSEYNNTVRDLLGVDLEPAKDFPEDNSAYGFDNISEALSISPLLMEKYMAAAERVSRYAVFGPELKKPATVRFTPTLPRRLEGNPGQLLDPPFYTMQDYDATGLTHPGAFHTTHRFPATGEYLIRIFPNGTRPQGSEPQDLNLFLDGKLVQTLQVKERRTVTNEVEPVAHEFRLKVTAGPHTIAAAYPRLFEGLPVALGGPNPSKLPPPPPRDAGRVLPPLPKEATEKEILERKALLERIQSRNRRPRFDGIAVGVVELVGPFEYAKGPLPQSAEKIFVCGHVAGGHQPACDRTIVSSLAKRAFRRPVSASEIDGLLAVVSAARTRGRSFEQGISLAIQSMLVSPDFLFRIEKNSAPAAAGKAAQVGAYELASRLSYFLWSSTPDDELILQASRGGLRQPRVLEAQVRRMLKDPKAAAFVSNFVGQWLEVRRLEGSQPDRDRFPDFDDLLRAAMIQETELFFANVMREDRPVLDLLNGEYTFVNERLARHYGLKGVSGPDFQKVSLAGTGRAGILTHASVLTVSSYNNRTSPVLRGKWILENLLNEPPPPPPPDVPALDEASVGSTASLRQQMEKHRTNPVCASCHARMDPMGFALENYNAVGVWRTQDGKFPIDTTGTLPNGKAIKGPDDLRAILAADRDAFTRTLTEKLLMYAVGRGLERSDRGAVRRIATEAAANDYRFSSLIIGIVSSPQFQMQRGDKTKS